jgi:hypothetical protein
MKTLEQIKERGSQTLDGRDFRRLSQFLTANQLKDFGFTLIESVSDDEWNKKVIPFTRENILIQLKEDVEFGFEKALNKRGISAGLMFETVRMWNWILEEGLEDFDSYAMYGLPLFKATALKYGWNNPIGNDSGSEDFYNEH